MPWTEWVLSGGVARKHTCCGDTGKDVPRTRLQRRPGAASGFRVASLRASVLSLSLRTLVVQNSGKINIPFVNHILLSYFLLATWKQSLQIPPG